MISEEGKMACNDAKICFNNLETHLQYSWTKFDMKFCWDSDHTEYYFYFTVLKAKDVLW